MRLALLQKWLYSEPIGSCKNSLTDGDMASLSFGKRFLHGREGVREGIPWEVV